MNYFENAVLASQIFGGSDLKMPNKGNAKEWIEKIENELSPENLTCDGECTQAQVRDKSRRLHAALAHCQGLLDAEHLSEQSRILANVASHLSPFADEGAKDGFAFMNQFTRMSGRHARTLDRQEKLGAAVQKGFTVGVRVKLSNGVQGKIVKINRTRVKVQGDDSKLWMVPPSCMILA